MILTNTQMFMTEGDQAKQTGCSEFLRFFEDEFKGLEGLSLVKGPDPVKNSSGRKPPQPSKPPVSTPKPVQAPVKIDMADKQLSQDDKNNLKLNIGKLSGDQKRGIVEIVKKCVSRDKNSGSSFEFELDQLSNQCLHELQAYVNKCVKENDKKAKRKKNDQERRARNQEAKTQQQMKANQAQNPTVPNQMINPAQNMQGGMPMMMTPQQQQIMQQQLFAMQQQQMKGGVPQMNPMMMQNMNQQFLMN